MYCTTIPPSLPLRGRYDYGNCTVIYSIWLVGCKFNLRFDGKMSQRQTIPTFYVLLFLLLLWLVCIIFVPESPVGLRNTIYIGLTNINPNCTRDVVLNYQANARAYNYYFIWSDKNFTFFRQNFKCTIISSNESFQTSQLSINTKQVFAIENRNFDNDFWRRHLPSSLVIEVDKFLPAEQIIAHNISVPHVKYYYDRFFDINSSLNQRRLAILHGVFTNIYGTIIDPRTCSIARNGGCYSGNFKSFYDVTDRAQSYDIVISLTAPASGNWHFPIEILPALADLGKEFLHSSVVYVPDKTPYIVQWLELAGWPIDRLVADKVIYANTLLVPEQGRCYAPFKSQVSWLLRLRDHSLMHDNKKSSSSSYENQINNLPTAPAPAAAPRAVTLAVAVGSKLNSSFVIILVLRRGIRCMENEGSVLGLLTSLSGVYGVQIKVHNVAQTSISVRAQIALFSSANLIIGMHGAGLLFSVFAPIDACLIELMPVTGHVLCYARLAYARGLSYIMLTVQPRQRQKQLGLNHTERCYYVPVRRLLKALNTCPVVRDMFGLWSV